MDPELFPNNLLWIQIRQKLKTKTDKKAEKNLPLFGGFYGIEILMVDGFLFFIDFKVFFLSFQLGYKIIGVGYGTQKSRRARS